MHCGSLGVGSCLLIFSLHAISLLEQFYVFILDGEYQPIHPGQLPFSENSTLTRACKANANLSESSYRRAPSLHSHPGDAARAFSIFDPYLRPNVIGTLLASIRRAV